MSSMPNTINHLSHGGDIERAQQEFGGTLDDWLDLSTGISPWAYPVPELCATAWHRLPPAPEKLIEIAANYYACEENMIAVSHGSQMAIRLIPALIQPSQTVAIPTLGYQEHKYSWQLAGHQIIEYQNEAELHNLVISSQVTNAVLINPNNPTGEQLNPSAILAMAEKIAGLVLVDEAFADVTPKLSILKQAKITDSLAKNIIVLRSLGKFFGLAGIRVGFAISNNRIIQRLQQMLSPWPLSGASQLIAESALVDQAWQQAQRVKIQQQANVIEHELTSLSLTPKFKDLRICAQGLFHTLLGETDTIKLLHQQFAEHRTWTRVGDPYQQELPKSGLASTNRLSYNWMRLSLPGDRLPKFTSTIQSIKTNSRL